MTGLIVVALVLAVIAWWVFDLGPLIREKKKAQAEARAKCEVEGHDFGPIFHAANDRRYPARECRRCKHVEHLDSCLGCGKVIRRKDGTPIE